MKYCLITHSVLERYAGPAENFFSFLGDNFHEATIISHPLNSQSELITKLVKIDDKGIEHVVRKKRRVRYPGSLLLDYFYTPSLNEFDVLITYNPWSTLIARLKLKRHQKLVFWGVDFNPRENKLTIAGILYRTVEKIALKAVDLQIENNFFALRARQERIIGLSKTPHCIVPIAAVGAMPNVFVYDHEKIRILYMGVLNDRNGVRKIHEIAEEMDQRGLNFSIAVFGEGPLESYLKSQAAKSKFARQIEFHGYVEDFWKIADLAKPCTVAIAPYSGTSHDYSYFADPGKVNWYFEVGLPVVMTNAVAMAEVFEKESGALVLDQNSTAKEWVDVLQQLNESQMQLEELSRRSLNFARAREKNVVFSDALLKIGLS